MTRLNDRIPIFLSLLDSKYACVDGMPCCLLIIAGVPLTRITQEDEIESSDC
jgi:hypothetical protein